MAQQEKVFVQVHAVRNNVFITAKYKEYKYNWEIPEGMSIYFYPNREFIQFTDNGNISRIGRVEIKTPEETIKYSINLSKGRLRLIE